jgi:hypothetical protein
MTFYRCPSVRHHASAHSSYIRALYGRVCSSISLEYGCSTGTGILLVRRRVGLLLISSFSISANFYTEIEQPCSGKRQDFARTPDNRRKLDLRKLSTLRSSKLPGKGQVILLIFFHFLKLTTQHSFFTILLQV